MEVNEKKEVVVDVNCRTSRPGVFAAGDITNEKSKQIIIAAGDGAKAALEAYRVPDGGSEGIGKAGIFLPDFSGISFWFGKICKNFLEWNKS